MATVSITGSELAYIADPGETNQVLIAESGGVITITESAQVPIVAGPGVTSNGTNSVSVPTTGLASLNIFLGDGNDTLNAAGLQPSSGLNRTVIQGASGDDILVGSGLNDFFIEESGNDFIDGLTAISVDQWSASFDSNIELSDAGLIVNGETDLFQNIEVVSLSGGPSANRISASGVTQQSGITGINLNGREGDDTLIGGAVRDNFQDFLGNNTLDGTIGNQDDSFFVIADEDMSIDNATIVVGSSTSSYVGIERVDLWGGPGDNTIDASALAIGGSVTRLQIQGFGGNDVLRGSELDDTIRDGGGANDISGGDGFDLLIIDVDADQVLTSNTEMEIGGLPSTFVGFERLTLAGGGGDNTLDASALDGASGIDFVSFDGRGGDDRLIGSQVDDEFRDISGNNFIDGTSPAAGSRDRAVFFNDVDMSLADAATPGYVDAVVGTSFTELTNIQQITLVGNSGDNRFDASLLTSASGVELYTIAGLAGDDTILPSSDPTLNASVDGGGNGVGTGFDTIDLRHFSIDPSVAITGPGSTDGQKGTINATTTFNNIEEFLLPITNVPPNITSVSIDASIDDIAAPGELVTLVGMVSDENASDVHTATIDWGDGTQSTAAVNSNGELLATHTYAAGGMFEVTLTVDDGTASTLAYADAHITGTRLTDQGVLQIVGSNAKDNVHIKNRGNSLRVDTRWGHGRKSRAEYPSSAITQILILTGNSADVVHLDHRISKPAMIDGGNGHDVLRSGSGDDVIRGGDGNDIIHAGAGDDVVLAGSGNDLILGGTGRDLLVGGLGFDAILGGSQDDILIGGSTAHDDSDVALLAISAEWSSDKPLSVRKQNLTNGTGDNAGLNASYFLDSPSLIDHGQFDLLLGGFGFDWFPEED